MALTKTTLAASCGSDDLKLNVTSSTGATPGCLVQVGDEFMNCVSVDTATQIGVRSRGSQGGRAKAHGLLSPVTFGLGLDFPDVPPGTASPTSTDWDVREVGVVGGYDPGVAGQNTRVNTEVVITTAAQVAQTITAPSQGADGTEVRFLANNNVAHVLTFSPAIGGKVTGTFAAGGASLTLRAQNGAWTILASGGITFA